MKPNSKHSTTNCWFLHSFFSTQKQDKNYFTRISTENSLSIDDPNNRNLLELVVLSHLFSFFSAFFFHG